MSLSVLGTTFVVQGLTPADAARTQTLLAPFLTHATTEPDVVVRQDANEAGWTLSGGGETVSGGSRVSAVPALVAVVNRVALKRTALLAVHAGVVSRGGAVLAFPCPSGGGKSTLTGALLQRGAEYVSDEALCIDRATGDVVAYPKPVALSTWSASRLGLETSTQEPELLYPAGDLGAAVPDAGVPLRLRHILRLERREGEPRLTSLPSSVAVAQLLRHSFNHFHEPRGSFELIGQVVRPAAVWLLEYDDPVEGAALVDELLTPADPGSSGEGRHLVEETP